MTLVPLLPEDANDILFAAQRTCCVCRVFGKPVQLHHIDEDYSHNAIDNLAVLCLECRHQTQIQGGLARHLSHSEVTRYRDDWHSRVHRRRERANALALEIIGAAAHAAGRASLRVDDYIPALPALRKAAYARARSESNGGTLRTVEGSFAILDVMEGAMTALGSYYPEGHFGAGSVRDYISELLATQVVWQYHRHQTPGHGHDEAAVPALVAESVVVDAERMVVELVESLTHGLAAPGGAGFVNWKKEWDASQHLQPSFELDVSSGKRAVVSVTNRGEPFTLSMQGQLVKANAAIEHPETFEFLPRRMSDSDPTTNYTIATVDAYGVVAVYGEHLAVIQTWRCDGSQKLRFRLALTFLSNERGRAQPVSKSLIEIECDPQSPSLKARVV